MTVYDQLAKERDDALAKLEARTKERDEIREDNISLRAKLLASCKACRELKLIGTTGCDHCEVGRVTMYSQGDACLSCKALAEAEKEEG